MDLNLSIEISVNCISFLVKILRGVKNCVLSIKNNYLLAINYQLSSISYHLLQKAGRNYPHLVILCAKTIRQKQFN